MSRALLLLAALVAAPLLGAPLQAQSPVGTTLTVNIPPVTGGGVRNLSFGSITPGDNADTGAGAEGNLSAAKWSFAGLQKNASFTLTFTLPASLTKGASTLPITWPAAYGSWCSYIAGNTCAGATTFNPSSGSFAVTATTPAGAGNNNRVLDVWLGGRISVPADAVSGIYNATLALTITGPGL